MKTLIRKASLVCPLLEIECYDINKIIQPLRDHKYVEILLLLYVFSLYLAL